jgi:hypothetical protein
MVSGLFQLQGLWFRTHSVGAFSRLETYHCATEGSGLFNTLCDKETSASRAVQQPTTERTGGVGRSSSLYGRKMFALWEFGLAANAIGLTT